MEECSGLLNTCTLYEKCRFDTATECEYHAPVLKKRWGLFSSRFLGLKVLSGSQIGSHSLTLSEPITAGYRNTYKALKQICSKSDFEMIQLICEKMVPKMVDLALKLLERCDFCKGDLEYIINYVSCKCI